MEPVKTNTDLFHEERDRLSAAFTASRTGITFGRPQWAEPSPESVKRQERRERERARKEQAKRESLTGKIVAEIQWGDPDDESIYRTDTDVVIRFTDGTRWEIGTCSCCGLGDIVQKPKKK